MNDPALIRQMLRHQGEFMAYIMAIVHDLDAAEEIFQNAAVVVIQHDAAEPIHDFRAWAKEIVRRQALRHVRCEGRGSRYTATEPELLEQIDLVFDESARDDGADETLRQREIEALRECAGRLPERQRVMVAMRYERRASFDTISAAVGSTAGAVQRALSRTRRTLHDCVRHRLEQTGVMP
jgi:RNA polymerase sigma-70 factor (ECF subfamily)